MKAKFQQGPCSGPPPSQGSWAVRGIPSWGGPTGTAGQVQPPQKEFPGRQVRDGRGRASFHAGGRLGAATSADPPLQARSCIRPSRCWVGGTPGPWSRLLSQEDETVNVSVLGPHGSSRKDPEDKRCGRGRCRHEPSDHRDLGRAESRQVLAGRLRGGPTCSLSPPSNFALK